MLNSYLVSENQSFSFGSYVKFVILKVFYSVQVG